MIDYIKGELAELTPAQAIVEAYGVGYALNISLNTYEAIQGKPNVKLFVHEALVTGGRDDSYTFFGFASKQERDLYRLLITVSGVGANTARMILSSASPSELCGQLPIDPATGLIPEGIAAQTAQSLKNIQAILAQQEMTLANVVKTTVFLADINDFAEMNKVYGEYFAQPYPARSAVQVGKLPKDAPLEIECIAVK